MSGMNDASKAQDRFDSTVTRGLLTKEERRIEALRKAAEQADREFSDACIAMDRLRERVSRLEEAAKQATIDYESAKAQEAQ